ncbi:GGDEF domain-containing protein [Roseateles sp. PN1]|uniref:GGDEF domain-containing protein n=1 Tax=Roseateles sp. PN1 TaxID=3137372 RepID=UPI0031386751
MSMACWDYESKGAHVSGELSPRWTSCSLRGALLSLALLSAGCGPQDAAPTGASQLQQGQVASSAFKQPADADLLREIEAVERLATSNYARSEALLSELQARSAPGSAERLQILTMRGEQAAGQKNQQLAEQMLSALRTWPEGPGRGLAEMAHSFLQAKLLSEKGERQQAIRTMAALPAFLDSQMPKPMLQRFYLFLALEKADVGDFDGSIAAGLEALKVADRMGQSWRRAVNLAQLSSLCANAQQFERSQQLADEALLEAMKDPDPVLLYSVHNSRAIAFTERHDLEQASQASAQVIANARQVGSDRLLALALANSADVMLKMGRYADAIKAAEEALPLALSSHDQVAELVARYNIGFGNIGLKRVEEGRREVLQAIALENKAGSVSGAASGWLELGGYLDRAGDASGAIAAYLQHRRWSDEAFREDTRKTMLEADARYDDERRSKALDLLGRDNNLKAERLRARDLQLKLWAAVGACVVLSSVLLGLAYQRIRKTNQALARSNEALKIQSERDPLTGLANRRHFQAVIQRGEGQPQFSGALFLIDIDHFKRINDVFGHAAGDAVLIEVAKRLTAALRELDLVVRWGGEEFLILVAAHEATDAKLLAQRLLDLIASQPIKHGRDSIHVTASIGFASLPVQPHGLLPSWERAIDLVDTAMYMAKAHGRNKAYGIESMQAKDEPELQALAAQMEAAWQAGHISVQTLHGPVASPEVPA